MATFTHHLLLVMLVVAVAPSLVIAQGEVRVFGTVHSTQGAPLPGAVVWIQGLPARTQTDAQGRFVVAVTVAAPIPGAGVYAGLQGYKPAGFIVPIDPANPPRLPVNIVLEPAAPPPPPTPAYQAAPPPPPSAAPQPTQPVYVQTYSAGPADGLPSPVGYDNASSTAPKGFETKQVRFIMGKPVIVEEPKATTPPPPTAPTAPPPPPTPTGPPVEFVIEGRVLNDRGGPIGGAQVIFANRRDAYAETDRRGNFKLVITVPKARVRMGRTLVVRHKSFLERTIPIEFNPDEEAGLSLPNIRLMRYRGLLR